MEEGLNASVLKYIEVAPGLIILQVEPDRWDIPPFEPGQYAVIGLPGSAPRAALSDPEEPTPPPDKLIKRPYSIASSSLEKKYLELYITLIRSGSLTPRIFALKAGDRLFMSEKIKGMFTLKDVPKEANLVMVATGTGVAPYMSMIRTELMENPERRFALFHGARHSWDLGYRAELATLDYYHKNFAYIPVVSRPGDEKEGWTGAGGYVQEQWGKGALERSWGFKPTPADTHVFLCGAPAMLEAMVQTLANEGFKEHKKKEPGQVHLERFW